MKLTEIDLLPPDYSATCEIKKLHLTRSLEGMNKQLERETNELKRLKRLQIISDVTLLLANL